jgi:SAM-dependent methyltransferase
MDIGVITGRFDEAAEEYDGLRRKFIPCFDDFYGTGISLLGRLKPRIESILDLGAGTGLLDKYLLARYPDARYTLVDVSERMLEVARRRFAGSGNFRFSVSDYSEGLPEGRFDLVASALSIHHLEEGAKARLYRAAFDSLEPGGCLLNLDQFDADSGAMSELYDEWWYDFIGRSGVGDVEKAAWLARRELDRENSIEATRDLLVAAGFATAQCVYSYMKFGVMLAIK